MAHRYTAQQIRLCASHEKLALECMEERRWGRGRKKRPLSEYREILRKRATGVTLRQIGQEHGNVSGTTASVLLFHAFVMQERGEFDDRSSEGGDGKMKKILWRLETGMCGCDREGEIEVEDNATEDDIEDAVREDMWNCLSLTWQAAE